MHRKGIAAALVVVTLLALLPAALAAADTIGYVTSTGLNIREKPSATSTVLRCAEFGDKLTILRTEGDWYFVQFNSSVSGYAAKKYISAKQTTSSSTQNAPSTDDSLPDSISDLGGAPNTSKKGDRNSSVVKLQKALKIHGYYTGNADGIYGDGTEEAVKKFQRARGLTADGVAGKVTIKLLFGENAANDKGDTSTATAPTATGSSGSYTTEKLDWYKDHVSTIIGRGVHMTIKDIRTGNTFRAKHLFGDNHMDAEPLTAADTAKLKAIYGGVWSWDRRPILIMCNNRVFAASMNGMPHGDESIYDNDFNGQFCIHFLNSKTHGTSKVDADHQYCVNVAAKSSW